MRKVFLTIAIAALGFTATYAQSATQQKQPAPAQQQTTPHQKETPEQKAEKSTAKLQEKLALSADQKQKVYAIELDKFKQAEEWHKKNRDTRLAQKDQHKTVKAATDAKIDQVLTADQKQKLDALRAEKKDKKGRRHHKGAPVPPPAAAPAPQG